LSVIAIACASRWITDGKAAFAFSTGLSAGAVFLTKPDLFLALTVTLAVAITLLWNSPAKVRSGPVLSILLASAGALIPVGAFAIYFAMAWGWAHAINAITGSWLPLLTTDAAHNDFYKWCLGLDRPSANIALAARHTAIVLVTVAFAGSCARYFSKRNYVLIAALLAGLLYLVYQAAAKYPWLEIGSSFAPLTLLGCGFLTWKSWKTRRTPEQKTLVLPLLWSVFSLFLLAKMGFATRIWHYGFYLALPAALFLIFCIAWLVPKELARFGIDARMFRILVAVFGIAGIVRLFGISDMFYQARNLAVADRGDRIYAFNRAVNEVSYGIDLTVSWLQKNTSPTNTVATIPEGVMVNYLLRRPNPAPYTGFTLPEIQAYGEPNMVSAYERNRPDYIVVIHRDSSEYGVGYFGSDPRFGREMMNWVKSNYSTALLMGHEPLQTNRFGIKILRRNGLSPLTTASLR
jgi:4-amino-4-deoxy-L-arabinose transferase-like glycosyltransferase